MSSLEERDLALRAMKLAAQRARERATLYGLKIGVWENGEITFREPESKAEQYAAANPNPSRVRESDD